MIDVETTNDQLKSENLKLLNFWSYSFEEEHQGIREKKLYIYPKNQLQAPESPINPDVSDIPHPQQNHALPHPGNNRFSVLSSLPSEDADIPQEMTKIYHR